MLQRLFIKNIALISELEVEFSSGLNIITGETGSGKSIIIDSINLALGYRAERELIKTGEKRARVEAEFSFDDDEELCEILEAAAVDYEDNTLIISRELTITDESKPVKSVCRINGSVISLSDLREITSRLVDVHGQHEHQALLNRTRHMGYLDNFSSDIHALVKETGKLYSEYHKLERSMHEGFVSEEARAQRIDILSYQIGEIEAVSPELGEDEKLEAEERILANSERIMQSLYNAKNLLLGGEQGAVNCVKTACNELYPLTDFSDEYRELANGLSEAYYALESAAYSVRDAADIFSFDAGRLDEVQSRLAAISKLKRKYGNSMEDLLRFAENARSELFELENSDKKRAEQQAELAKLREKYDETAQKLTMARRSAAEKFSARVCEQLSDLGLGKAVFSVNINEMEGCVPSPHGKDDVEFMFSANPGEPQKSLSKVASGGEVSRIMLALKTVLADTDKTDCMIFDEIDTGISGTSATVVGQKMSAISVDRQILAITHLPQIAAFADSHYVVEKTQDNDSTNSHLRLLSPDESASELARIMGGGDSALALEHAKELIEKSRSLKKL